MIKAISVSFALKRGKLASDGTAPLYIRITVEGSRVEFTTRRSLNPEHWNAEAQKMKGNSNETKIFNQYLKTLEQQLFDAHRQMTESKLTVTAEALRDQVTGRTEADQIKMLVPIFKEHNSRIKALLGKTTLPGH